MSSMLVTKQPTSPAPMLSPLVDYGTGPVAGRLAKLLAPHEHLWSHAMGRHAARQVPLLPYVQPPILPAHALRTYRHSSPPKAPLPAPPRLHPHAFPPPPASTFPPQPLSCTPTPLNPHSTFTFTTCRRQARARPRRQEARARRQGPGGPGADAAAQEARPQPRGAAALPRPPEGSAGAAGEHHAEPAAGDRGAEAHQQAAGGAVQGGWVWTRVGGVTDREVEVVGSGGYGRLGEQRVGDMGSKGRGRVAPG